MTKDYDVSSFGLISDIRYYFKKLTFFAYSITLNRFLSQEYFKEQDDSKRTGNYTDVVNKYYDLATSFYEYGWGESFHFAHRYRWETLRESIIRHEHYLASKLNVKKGDKVLDVGCGIGGPLREIAAFTERTWTD